MPINMTPEDYYEAFTLGNYYDFINNPGCVRRAFNAAIAASHLADCYYYFYSKNDPERVSKYTELYKFRDYISNNTDNYFRDIHSIANAYKHLYTGNQKHPENSTISSAGTIESIGFIDEEVEQLFEKSEDRNASKFIVIYTRKSGEQMQFKQAIDTVIHFWETVINKM